MGKCPYELELEFSDLISKNWEKTNLNNDKEKSRVKI